MGGSRPRVILCAAVSADGRMATASGDSRLSSREDIARVHRLRARADAILVGRNTAMADDPLLTVRLARGKNPTRVILDSAASLPETLRIFRTARCVRTIIAVSANAPEERLARLGRLPVEVAVAGRSRVSIRQLLKILARKGIGTVLVEGGGTVNWSFVKDGLFDELYLTVSPYLVGGTGAPPLVAGDGFKTVGGSCRLALVSSRRLKDHIVLHYKREPGRI